MTSALTRSLGHLGSVPDVFTRVGPMLLTTLSAALGRRLEQAVTYSRVPSNFPVATVIFMFNILLMFLRRGVASVVPPQLTSAYLSPVHSLFFFFYFRNAKVQRNSPKRLRINCAQLWCDLYDVRCLCVRCLSFDVNELAWSEVISHDLNASILVVLVSK